MNYKVIGWDGREYGPVSAEQVRQWIAERRLNAASLVQPEGATEWKSLSLLPEFQAALGGPVPPSLPVPPAMPVAPAGYPRTNNMAVWGFIMGLLSLCCCCCCYGFPFNVLGIVFSAVALSQIGRNPQLEQGRALAIAGLVLSLLATVAPLVGALAGLLFGLAGAAHPRGFHL